ncbi:MAG: thiamine-phosphate kinase [Flavobacteriales bacterium]|nr:thiamine-phosphate kinase [Flavobacteriales bacterium]MCB9446727.1 thiamine-phosphate kinase [Flavobacteriales bacterium]
MIEDKPIRTEINELGEFGLIDHLTGAYETTREETRKGIGDDAAVILSGDHAFLVSTDMLVEGVHFDLTYTPLKHLGYKAITVNLSDIAAMNALPAQVTVSIAISNRFSLEALEELYSGIYLACKRYGVDLVGGDTTSSQSGLVISVTAMGQTYPDQVVYRSGATEGDLLVVTGDLGGAYMGLQILEREKAVYQSNPAIQPDLAGNDYILERQLKPEARIDIIKEWAKLGIRPTSLIDISDGLSSEALHLCKASKLGCRLYEEKLPLDATTIRVAEEFNLNTTTCALNGGEDYELLFTISQEDYDKLRNHPDFTVIGHMTEKVEGAHLVTQSGTLTPLQAQGWNALTSQNQPGQK